jgi:hypothetical protein
MSKKSEYKIVTKKEFEQINKEYRQIMKNTPNFDKDSPMKIYRWIESLVKLSMK